MQALAGSGARGRRIPNRYPDNGPETLDTVQRKRFHEVDYGSSGRSYRRTSRRDNDAFRHIVCRRRVMSLRKRSVMVLAPAVALVTAVAGCSNSSSDNSGGNPAPTLTGDCAKYQ